MKLSADANQKNSQPPPLHSPTPMKEIEVPRWMEAADDVDLAAVSAGLERLPFTKLDMPCWPEQYNYMPQVSFALAHSGSHLFLKYRVREKFMQARCFANNRPVHRDSCVEFFISLDEGEHYYNFEFNCIGTCKVGFGTTERRARKHLPDETIDRISRQVLITRSKNYSECCVAWELTVAIPAGVFFHQRLASFTGRRGTANFYKCGDDLPEPHYIAWREVKSDRPDFHRPDFFGNIRFL